MTVEVPSDSSRTRRIALVLVVALVSVALTGVAVWATFFREDDARQGQGSYCPAEPTTEQTSTANPGTTTQTADVATNTTGSTPPANQPVDAVVRPKIAFVLGGRIYIAEQDGSSPVAVAPAGGAYALSPDNKTIALVADASGAAGAMGTVSLVDTSSGMMTGLGQGARFAPPVWSTDSRWVFVATTASDGTSRIVRYARGDGASKMVATAASAVRASVEGDRIAYGGALGDDPVAITVAKLDGGGAKVVSGSKGAPAWGWGPGQELYYVTESETPGTWQLNRALAPKFKGEPIATLTLSAPAFAVGEVLVSADGRYVLMSAVGDDAHSRLWVADVEGQRIGAIATRHDAYPVGWDSSGRALLFEGNTFQGEPSVLVSVLPDGTSRRALVTGALR